MRITIKKLRQLIENQWSNYVRDVKAPSKNDRQAMPIAKLKTPEGEDELSPHLRDAEKIESDTDIWGPVPPKKNNLTFSAQLDPYTNDWSVLPTRRSGR